MLVTSGIHSTEVGGILTPLVLADRLARGEDAEARAILANTIIMLVPSLNPDGVDIVGDWYRSTLGTPREGRDPPELYHYYTGTTTTATGTRSRRSRRVDGRLAVHAVASADRQRHPPAGLERGPHLHSAVHGSRSSRTSTRSSPPATNGAGQVDDAGA